MIEKKYRRYYLFGYINYRNITSNFGIDKGESFVNRKVKDCFEYLGFKTPSGDYTKFAGVITWLEVLVSISIVLCRFLFLIISKVFISTNIVEGRVLFAPLTTAEYRVRDMLRSLDGINITTVSIPFVKNSFKNNEINALSVITSKDIIDSFISAIGIIFYMTRKYRKIDILFRSYSSFEYFLACRFIDKVELKNKIVYYSTYDRWGFLFCRANSDVIFIQHGKLDYITRLIRVGTPSIAYYISPEQKKILEDILFTSQVKESRYRKMLQFTNNKVLNNENGKLNVLIVSSSFFANEVLVISKMLCTVINIYVKPHPGEKKLEIYDILEKEYGAIMLDKTDYPKVDLVLSYNSTLADEYDMAGVKVIRWDLLKDISVLKDLILG